jgi:C-terminal processing protease CtpA/Prc
MSDQPTTLGIVLTALHGDGTFTVDVVPGGLAYKCGFEDSDTIVTIGGISPDRWLQDGERRGPVRVVLQRWGGR